MTTPRYVVGSASDATAALRKLARALIALAERDLSGAQASTTQPKPKAVIPISGEMSPHSPVSHAGTVVTPAAGLMNETFQSGALLAVSASIAYTLSCSVAT